MRIESLMKCEQEFKQKWRFTKGNDTKPESQVSVCPKTGLPDGLQGTRHTGAESTVLATKGAGAWAPLPGWARAGQLMAGAGPDVSCGVTESGFMQAGGSAESVLPSRAWGWNIAEVKILSSVWPKLCSLSFFLFLIDFFKRERYINLLFHLFMHSLVASSMCPDGGSDPQTWCTWAMFQQTELPQQALSSRQFGR